MTETIKFPDVEKLLVAYLKDSPPGDVFVATKKPAPDASQPSKQVIVTGNYNGSLDALRSSATAVLEVYANDYEAASELGLLAGAVVVQCPKDHIKRAVVVLGPVRLGEDGPMEKRSLSVDLIVKGTAL